MVVAAPKNAWRLATITTVSSVLGGLAGFFIGVFAFEAVEPLLKDLGKWDTYLLARDWFTEWGFWAVLAAGFSPIPYKIFTIAAGTMAMPLLPFVLASALGRASRFFLVAGLLYWGGERFESIMRRYVDVLGWAVVVLIIIAYLILSN